MELQVEERFNDSLLYSCPKYWYNKREVKGKCISHRVCYTDKR